MFFFGAAAAIIANTFPGGATRPDVAVTRGHEDCPPNISSSTRNRASPAYESKVNSGLMFLKKESHN